MAVKLALSYLGENGQRIIENRVMESVWVGGFCTARSLIYIIGLMKSRNM
jgi:hypothetical protein